MPNDARHWPHQWDPEPRWPALVAILAVGGLYAALPRYLVLGPRWVFLAVVGGLVVPTIVTHVRSHHLLNHSFGLTVNAVITAGLVASVILLIRELLVRGQKPSDLLLSAGALWATNV